MRRIEWRRWTTSYDGTAASSGSGRAPPPRGHQDGREAGGERGEDGADHEE
ncbi:hypothetical protein ABZY68_36335 [Streptomyces sp. NPDC006482]|uniref:hypothetical protein n=1 Tax=Streptomyces sp. NPDC006482 TaxID=3154306 RepID=UPI00339FE2C1